MPKTSSRHAGLCYAKAGNAVYARISDAPGHAKPMEAHKVGFTNVDSEVKKAISLAYGGDAYARLPSVSAANITTCAGAFTGCYAPDCVQLIKQGHLMFLP